MPQAHCELLARISPSVIQGNMLRLKMDAEDPTLRKVFTVLRDLGYAVREDDTDAPLVLWYMYTLSFNARELRESQYFQLLPKHSVSSLLDGESRGTYRIASLDDWDEGELSKRAMKQLLEGTLHAFDVSGQVSAVSNHFKKALEDAGLKGIGFESGFEIGSELATGKARPDYWLLKPMVALPPHSFVNPTALPGGAMLKELGFLSNQIRYAMRQLPQSWFAGHPVDYARTGPSEDGDQEEAGIEIASRSFMSCAKAEGAEYTWDTPLALG